MSDHILPTRYRHGQTDTLPLLSLSLRSSDCDEGKDIDESPSNEATAGTTLEFSVLSFEDDGLAFPDAELSKASQPAAQTSPYCDLDHATRVIRLIRVRHRASPGVIRCQLSTHVLAEAPEYTAVSYTWGRPDTECFIELNGTHFPVRKNLWRFLREAQHRATDDDKLFWIDALCIDQRNLLERTHQVGLMGKIFSRAEQVLVWLGPSYGGSDLAFQIMRKWSSTQGIPETELARIWWKPQGASLRRLCERPFWSRLWVLQEMVLAKDLVLACGNRRAPASVLFDILLRAQTLPPASHRDENHEYGPTMRSRAMSIIHQMRRARQRASLLDQMRVSQGLRCFDPRDKVYALLGIVGRGHNDIRPDYEIGMPSLLNIVLRNHHRHRPPKDLMDVRRQCQELCEAAGVPSHTIHTLENQPTRPAPVAGDAVRIRLLDEESGLTLWWACLYGHNEVAQFLIRRLDETLLKQHLRCSAREGRIDAIQFWLRTHLQLSYLQDERHSLLSVAAAHGKAALVEMLLQFPGIDANAKDHHGKAAVHIAASYGLTEVLTVLLKRKRIDVNILDDAQCSPLHLAIKWDRATSIRLLLTRADLDMNQVSAGLQTPLGFAVSRGQPDIVEMLLERTDLNVSAPAWVAWESRWRSPLHQSIEMKNDKIFTALLTRRDLDINAVDEQECPALHVALREGTDCAVFGLLNCSNIELRSRDGSADTPLHLAVRHGHDAIVLEMLRIHCYLGMFSASLELLNARACSLATKKDRSLIIAPAASPIDSSALANLQGKATDMALDFKSSVEASGSQIPYAPSPGHHVELNAVNRKGNAPLHEAILESRNNASALLLSMPTLDVNLVNRNGATPLYLAATSGNETAVRLLLMHSFVDVSIKTYAGLSPLDIARAKRHTGIVKLLLDFNGSAGAIDGRSHRALLEFAWSDDVCETLAVEEWANVDVVEEWANVDQPGFIEPETVTASSEYLHREPNYAGTLPTGPGALEATLPCGAIAIVDKRPSLPRLDGAAPPRSLGQTQTKLCQSYGSLGTYYPVGLMDIETLSEFHTALKYAPGRC